MEPKDLLENLSEEKIKACYVQLEKISVDQYDSDSDDSSDLPPLPFLVSSSRHSKLQSKKCTEDLLEEHRSLAEDIKVDNLSNDTINEKLKGMEVLQLHEEDNLSVSSDPVLSEENILNIFCVNDYLQFFNSRNVMLLECGYSVNKSGELTAYEKKMLSFQRVELEHVMSSFLCSSYMCCISRLKSFVTFLLKNLSVHGDNACVKACYSVLHTTLVKHSNAKNLTFSSAEIFMLLFNYGIDIDSFQFLHKMPDIRGHIEPKCENESFNKIPEKWTFNLKITLNAVIDLINNCEFKAKDLSNIIIFFLWMSLDSILFQENILFIVRECIFVSIEHISDDKWAKIMRDIAKTLISMEFSSLSEKWSNIYHMAESVPVHSTKSIDLRKYISFLALKCLSKNESIEVSSDVNKSQNGFSLSELQSLLQKLVEIDSNLLNFVPKFLDLCISNLKSSNEDILELCNILKETESALNPRDHEAKLHLLLIHSRLKLKVGKNSLFKVSPGYNFFGGIKVEVDQEIEVTNEPSLLDFVNVKEEPEQELAPDLIGHSSDKIISFHDFNYENDEDDDSQFCSIVKSTKTNSIFTGRLSANSDLNNSNDNGNSLMNIPVCAYSDSDVDSKLEFVDYSRLSTDCPPVLENMGNSSNNSILSNPPVLEAVSPYNHNQNCRVRLNGAASPSKTNQKNIVVSYRIKKEPVSCELETAVKDLAIHDDPLKRQLSECESEALKVSCVTNKFVNDAISSPSQQIDTQCEETVNAESQFENFLYEDFPVDKPTVSVINKHQENVNLESRCRNFLYEDISVDETIVSNVDMDVLVETPAVSNIDVSVDEPSFSHVDVPVDKPIVSNVDAVIDVSTFSDSGIAVEYSTNNKSLKEASSVHELPNIKEGYCGSIPVSSENIDGAFVSDQGFNNFKVKLESELPLNTDILKRKTTENNAIDDLITFNQPNLSEIIVSDEDVKNITNIKIDVTNNLANVSTDNTVLIEGVQSNLTYEYRNNTHKSDSEPITVEENLEDVSLSNSFSDISNHAEQNDAEAFSTEVESQAISISKVMESLILPEGTEILPVKVSNDTAASREKELKNRKMVKKIVVDEEVTFIEETFSPEKDKKNQNKKSDNFDRTLELLDCDESPEIIILESNEKSKNRSSEFQQNNKSKYNNELMIDDEIVFVTDFNGKLVNSKSSKSNDSICNEVRDKDAVGNQRKLSSPEVDSVVTRDVESLASSNVSACSKSTANNSSFVFNRHVESPLNIKPSTSQCNEEVMEKDDIIFIKVVESPLKESIDSATITSHNKDINISRENRSLNANIVSPAENSINQPESEEVINQITSISVENSSEPPNMELILEVLTTINKAILEKLPNLKDDRESTSEDNCLNSERDNSIEHACVETKKFIEEYINIHKENSMKNIMPENSDLCSTTERKSLEEGSKLIFSGIVSNAGIVNTSNADTVNISNTGIVNTNNIDTVNVSYTDMVTASSTDTVNVSNTDTVNVSNTGTVNVSNTDTVKDLSKKIKTANIKKRKLEADTLKKKLKTEIVENELQTDCEKTDRPAEVDSDASSVLNRLIESSVPSSQSDLTVNVQNTPHCVKSSLNHEIKCSSSVSSPMPSTTNQSSAYHESEDLEIVRDMNDSSQEEIDSQLKEKNPLIVYFPTPATKPSTDQIKLIGSNPDMPIKEDDKNENEDKKNLDLISMQYNNNHLTASVDHNLMRNTHPNSKAMELLEISESNGPLNRKRKIYDSSNPSVKVKKYAVKSFSRSGDSRLSKHTTLNKNVTPKSPLISPKKHFSAKNCTNKQSQNKFFNYKQRRPNFLTFKNSRKTALLTKTGLNLTNVLREQVISSNQQEQKSSTQGKIYSSDESDSEVLQLFCDPKRYEDKECLIVFESEDQIVLDSD